MEIINKKRSIIIKTVFFRKDYFVHIQSDMVGGSSITVYYDSTLIQEVEDHLLIFNVLSELEDELKNITSNPDVDILNFDYDI